MKTSKSAAAPKVSMLSFKKSRKRGTWQMKGNDHTIYQLLHMRPLIEAVLPFLGYEPNDRERIYLLEFSTRRFEGSQILLRALQSPDRSRRHAAADTTYRVEESVWGLLETDVHLPVPVLERLDEPSDEVHLRISETKYSAFV